MKGRGGFTLIELLVSIILMVILLSAVTLIFMRTTETVAISAARTTVYTNARYALDILENDVQGCLPFTSGQQRFILENGKTNSGAGAAAPPSASANFHIAGPSGGAADLLLFRTTTTVGNTLQTAEVAYHLVPGNQVLVTSAAALQPLPAGPTGPGDPSRGQTVRPPPRPLYTLVRRTRVLNPGTGQWEQIPRDSLNNEIQDMELCYFVLSFNVEYLANNMSFSQLEPSPCPPTDPLGEGGPTPGPNDGQGGATPLRIPALRVTMVIVEDVGARQERQIQKEIWIPMG